MCLHTSPSVKHLSHSIWHQKLGELMVRHLSDGGWTSTMLLPAHRIWVQVLDKICLMIISATGTGKKLLCSVSHTLFLLLLSHYWYLIRANITVETQWHCSWMCRSSMVFQTDDGLSSPFVCCNLDYCHQTLRVQYYSTEPFHCDGKE